MSAPACVLTLEQVDDLHDHAHRILLYGNLVANGLDSYAAEDQTLEALHELVVEMIMHAQAAETVLEQGDRVDEKGGM